MNKQQCCLVQWVRMHGNLGATQLLRNTRWSRTTNEDSTALRGTHASLNDTHGGKKKPSNTAWRTAYAVTLCVAHLRCRRDKHRRIEDATRHPVLPRRSMHSLDVTHTNMTFTRSSQTTDLSTNVNTTNTDSFTHKTTNKTNKNPIRHSHAKHDKLKPSHERTTSRARLSGSKMEPTHRANNKSWRELVNKRRHVQYMRRKLEDQLIAPNKEHELDCFSWASWNCPMTQTKLQHAKRTATQNMCSVCKITETLKSKTFDLRRLPTLTRTSHVPRNAPEKNKNAPNTRNAFWHSINSRLSRSDSQNKHSNTTVSHTSHVAKETSESKRRCVSSETSASNLYIDWHPWLHAPHKNTCDTNVKKNLKQTQGTTCDDTQCTVKSRQEKLLSFNSDLETKLRILYFARHVPKSWSYWVRYGTPRWLAWQAMVQELTSGYSSPMPMWQTVRNQICNDRSTSAKHTNALPWTHTPNNDNFMKKPTPLKLTGNFQCASNKIERNVSLSTANNGFDLTTYHHKRPQQQTPQHSNATRQTWRQNTTKLRSPISTHEPGSNSQIFAPTNDGRNKRLTECLKNDSTKKHSP